MQKVNITWKFSLLILDKYIINQLKPDIFFFKTGSKFCVTPFYYMSIVFLVSLDFNIVLFIVQVVLCTSVNDVLCTVPGVHYVLCKVITCCRQHILDPVDPPRNHLSGAFSVSPPYNFILRKQISIISCMIHFY